MLKLNLLSWYSKTAGNKHATSCNITSDSHSLIAFSFLLTFFLIVAHCRAPARPIAHLWAAGVNDRWASSALCGRPGKPRTAKWVPAKVWHYTSEWHAKPSARLASDCWSCMKSTKEIWKTCIFCTGLFVFLRVLASVWMCELCVFP